MKPLILILRTMAGLIFTGLTVALIAALAIYAYFTPQLPDVESLKTVHFQVPLRVYSADGRLMAEFGEQRRYPVEYEAIPERLVQAFLAAEDDRFFEHPGVDYQGLLRAAFELVRTGEKRQGGSTITMQVARNFFLSGEKTFTRKFKEILLALRIERALSKEEILALYMNRIYLGSRAYGVAAAAHTYYGKRLEALSLAEMATIAGLPKAPSRDNPLASPERAQMRRNYVLGRMAALGYIDREAYQVARHEPTSASLHTLMGEHPLTAPYVAEMARRWAVERYGDAAYEGGYRVYTTVRGDWQEAARAALRQGLIDYTLRHGYRGPEAQVALDTVADEEARDALLARAGTVGGLQPALVTAVEEQRCEVYLGEGRTAVIEWDGLSWARPYISEDRQGPAPEAASDVVQPGDVVRVMPAGEGAWRLVQLPLVEGALVALSPEDGAIRALAGGFDHGRSKFNRAVQARRQPGSSFKPFMYSAALEHGFTTASILNDAPVVFDDPVLGDTWRPGNYSGRFHGPTRLREALVKSRNLVSIRLLRAVGIDNARRHAQRFGFTQAQLPRDLSLALGSAAVTPLELASGFAVFANGGYRVQPYLIDRVENQAGEVVYRLPRQVVCEDCDPDAQEQTAGPVPVVARVGQDTPADPGPNSAMLPVVTPAERVLPAQNAYLMTSMMQDVIQRGTGRRALQLGRSDLAGKTGTTNDQHDVWFAGFTPDVAATVWIGFDNHRPLGRRETGAGTALPAWIDFMRTALEAFPERTLPEPPGLVAVRIDPETGLQIRPGQETGIFEMFREGEVPEEAPPPVGLEALDDESGTFQPLF